MEIKSDSQMGNNNTENLKWKRFKKIAWSESHHLHLQWKFKSLAESLLEVIRQNIAGRCQQSFD